MKKLLILGLLLTSTAYAEGHDLQFEVEAEDLSSDNKFERSFTEMKVLNIDYEYAFLPGVIFAAGASLGFVIAIVIFASLREKLEDAPIPEVFKGYPISFILASLLSLAFMGFAGMFGLQI